MIQQVTKLDQRYGWPGPVHATMPPWSLEQGQGRRRLRPIFWLRDYKCHRRSECVPWVVWLGRAVKNWPRISCIMQQDTLWHPLLLASVNVTGSWAVLIYFAQGWEYCNGKETPGLPKQEEEASVCKEVALLLRRFGLDPTILESHLALLGVKFVEVLFPKFTLQNRPKRLSYPKIYLLLPSSSD